MIDLKAAKELKHSITTGFDSGGMRAAEALIASIEEEYGPLDTASPPTPFLNWMNQIVAMMAEEPAPPEPVSDDKNLKDLVDFHRLHDPVFSLVYEHLTSPEIIERELKAAEARHQAGRRAAEGVAPIPTTIQDWQKVIHQYALDKGWWDKDNRTFGDICTLFTSEVSEAYDEYRNGHEVTETYFKPEAPDKPEGVPTELADVVIRIFDYCTRVGIDLQAVMAQKHAYNLTRSYRHGNKRT